MFTILLIFYCLNKLCCDHLGSCLHAKLNIMVIYSLFAKKKKNESHNVSYTILITFTFPCMVRSLIPAEQSDILGGDSRWSSLALFSSFMLFHRAQILVILLNLFICKVLLSVYIMALHGAPWIFKDLKSRNSSVMQIRCTHTVCYTKTLQTCQYVAQCHFSQS